MFSITTLRDWTPEPRFDYLLARITDGEGESPASADK